jgi:hypothetical protein
MIWSSHDGVMSTSSTLLLVIIGMTNECEKHKHMNEEKQEIYVCVESVDCVVYELLLSV